jgi:hypothetical protein
MWLGLNGASLGRVEGARGFGRAAWLQGGGSSRCGEEAAELRRSSMLAAARRSFRHHQGPGAGCRRRTRPATGDAERIERELGIQAFILLEQPAALGPREKLHPDDILGQQRVMPDAVEGLVLPPLGAAVLGLRVGREDLEDGDRRADLVAPPSRPQVTLACRKRPVRSPMRTRRSLPLGLQTLPRRRAFREASGFTWISFWLSLPPAIMTSRPRANS